MAKERDNDSVLQGSEEQWSLTPGALPVCAAVMSAYQASQALTSLCPVLHLALALPVPVAVQVIKLSKCADLIRIRPPVLLTAPKKLSSIDSKY